MEILNPEWEIQLKMIKFFQPDSLAALTKMKKVGE
jgi:hypothetical protein